MKKTLKEARNMWKELNKPVKISYENEKDSLYKYAAGYYECGMTLINTLLDENRYQELSELSEAFRQENIKLEEESNIYPIMFLFRQYIELIIKALHLEFEITESKNIFATHKISEIWPGLKEKLLVQENDNDELEGITEILDEIIKKFSNIDDNSFCFRYPINQEKKPYFKNDKTYNLYEIRSDINEFDTLIHEFI